MKIQKVSDPDLYPDVFRVHLVFFPNEDIKFEYTGREDPSKWTKEEIVYYFYNKYNELSRKMRDQQKDYEDLKQNHIKRGFRLSEAFDKIKKYESGELKEDGTTSDR